MLGHVSLRLAYLAVLRVFGWLMVLHRWKWEDVRRRFTGHTGRWREPSADGIALFDMATVPVSPAATTEATRSPTVLNYA